MSKRNDEVWTNYYAPHLNVGGKLRNNPTNNKQVRTERMYIRKLTELAMNRFRWSGLPNSVDERFLEKILFERGLAVFYYEDKFNAYLALRGSPAGQPNMYDNPVAFQVSGNAQINRTVSCSKKSKTKAVPIWSSYSRVPEFETVLLYAEKLANLDRSIEINSNNLRQTKIIVANEDQRLSFQNFNRQIEEGFSAIFATNSQMAEQIQALDIGVDPRGLLALMEAKTRLWNECMTMLGIDNNPGQDKKERLVSGEVEANEDQVNSQRAVNLKARLQACEVINRRFGFQVTVELESDSHGHEPGQGSLESSGF